MSAWMTLACGANEDSCPVTRSSNRAPNVISRSARCSGHRRDGAVHARHPRQRVRRERTARHQGGDH